MDSYLDERERWEALMRWLRENGPAMVAGVALAVLGFTGYRWWHAHTDQRDLEAGAVFVQMENSFAKGDDTSGFIAAGELERNDASTPYADQARLASAAVFVDGGQLDRAAAELRAVMQHPHDSILGLIARLRLARVQIAQNQPQQALATLAAVDPGAFAPRYDVVRGDAYYALGQKPQALAQYRLARARDPGGETDTGLLDLEISELAANLPAAAPATTPGARVATPAATAAGVK